MAMGPRRSIEAFGIEMVASLVTVSAEHPARLKGELTVERARSSSQEVVARKSPREEASPEEDEGSYTLHRKDNSP
jgi:hypothetical protein